MYIALSAFHWEFFYQHFIENFLYTALIFCMEGGSAEIFDMLFLFWPISTSGFDLSDFSFTKGKRGQRAFPIAELGIEIIIYIDLKIRLLQKRENERLNGYFQYTKNGINSVQYIPVHNKAQKHIYIIHTCICMDTTLLCLILKADLIFFFNKAFNQDALEYKTQNPAMLFTKESIENAEFWSRIFSRFFFSLKLL